MSGRGFLGNVLGPVGAILGSLVAPEIGIPAALATGAGGFLGGTAGGLASGEPIGKALLGGAETGAISGITSGIGSELFGGSAGDITGTQVGTPTPLPAGSPALSQDISGITGFPTTPTAIGGVAAPGGGAGGGAAAAAPAGPGGGNFSGLATTTGAGPSDISASLGGTALPAIGTATGVSGPASTTLPTPGADLGTIAGAPTGLPTGDIGRAVSLGGSGAPTNPALNQDFIGGNFDPAAAVAGNPSGDFLSRAASYVGEHPGVPLAAGGLLASTLVNGGFRGGQIPGSQPVSAEAGTLSTQANQNLNAINTGNIPAGAQTAIDQAARSAKASTLSLYNSLGLGNSTVAQEAIANIDQTVATQKFDIARDLVSTGISEAQLSSTLYTKLMEEAISQDQNLQRALASFSGALAGGAVRPEATTATTPTPA